MIFLNKYFKRFNFKTTLLSKLDKAKCKYFGLSSRWVHLDYNVNSPPFYWIEALKVVSEQWRAGAELDNYVFNAQREFGQPDFLPNVQKVVSIHHILGKWLYWNETQNILIRGMDVLWIWLPMPCVIRNRVNIESRSEVRASNWRHFLRKWKSVENWLRY